MKCMRSWLALCEKEKMAASTSAHTFAKGVAYCTAYKKKRQTYVFARYRVAVSRMRPNVTSLELCPFGPSRGRSSGKRV